MNNKEIKEQIELTMDDLNKEVSKLETSRERFADTDQNVPHDKLTYEIKTKDTTIKDTTEDKDNTIRFDSDEEKWLYACNNTTNSEVYQIDKDGNLLSKLDVNTLWNRVGVDYGDVSLADTDKEKILNMIRETKKQINFVNSQEMLKEEIKGYPEYSEGFARAYDPNSIIPRFKNEKNILRSLLAPKESAGDLRILLSIVNSKSIDYFNQLINDKIIDSDMFPISGNYAKVIYQHIRNSVENYNQFPAIKTLVNEIGLPYSKEFFDEYLMDDLWVDEYINLRYLRLRKAYCEHIGEQLKTKSCVSSDILKALNHIDTITTPPSSDNSFENLKNYVESIDESINLSTGIKILDENNAFLKKGKISTVFAYTGNFKTMFCSNVAYSIIQNGSNVLYLSLEINKEEMYINFLSRHSYNFEHKVSHSDIKNGLLDEEQKEYLFNTIYPDFESKLKSHLLVYDETDITSNTYAVFSKLLSQADNYFSKKTGHGLDLVVVDHLNLLKFDSGEKVQNEYSAVNHWMSYFRKNSISFLNQKRQISILCACQSSREGFKEASRNGKYKLTGIAEGNEIERGSQLVLSIYTTEADRSNNITQMQILKSRDNEPDKLLAVGLNPKYYVFGLETKQISSEPISEPTDDYDDMKENDVSGF